jgi:nitroimidazol reductase NimA-like FMN-containing flavoprotein (pyridoxamine 5'-phosphate oxidase superfamily)
MIEIEDMRRDEIEAVLRSISYGHLGCADGGQPYVVPVHYAFEDPNIYVYTTEGKKAEIIRSNPKVCLQVEDVEDGRNWQSVIVFGEAVQVEDKGERDTAMALLAKVNPTLTPAVSIRWMDNWVRENIEVIMRITPNMMTGRATVARSETNAPFAPGSGETSKTIY